MIRVLTATDRLRNLGLFDQMFRARAAIFHERLGWQVDVRDGWEIDHYDDAAASLYLVSLDENGSVAGSLRLMPAAGETMLKNEFSGFFSAPFEVPGAAAWECTRFCVHPRRFGAPDRDRRVSSDLLIGLCEFALASGVDHIIGLYDNAMTRVYRRIGWSPRVVATARPEIGALSLGVWDVSPGALEAMTRRLGMEQEVPAQQHAA